MKRILITGLNSYIGTNVDRYLQEYNASQGSECYRVERISQKDENWAQLDFGTYDTILDVTGIAHADVGKVSDREKENYYQVNCDLAVKTAQKAKREGVKQFIYLSSIIVYGESAPVGKKKHITKETIPEPANFYGDSKLQAEKGLQPLEDESFKVSIVRLPFVYGTGSKGNYRVMAKLAKRLPVFPTIPNERSMIYIENLNEFLRLLIEQQGGGLWFPQNAKYSSTVEIVREIAAAHQKKIFFCSLLNPVIRLMSKLPGKIGKITNKAFGNLTYDSGLSEGIEGYCIYSTTESIRRTEEKN
ncbi:MAG: sugar nucleotide-binding protein [Lachnospiraceae bacterium]|nr:sugar nucleotide-binding protein [Lachnospiraceae bacterium]